MRIPLAILSIAFMAILVSCGDDDRTTAPTPTATVPAVATKNDRLTGLPAIDSLITAATTGDVPGLVSQIEYVRLACVTRAGVGSPPQCENGEVEGTEVDAFPYSACEGEYVRTRSVTRLIQSRFGGATKLYAVVNPKLDNLWQPISQAVYGLIFDVGAASPGGGALLFTDSDGKILALQTGCGSTPAELFQKISDKVLVAPPP